MIAIAAIGIFLVAMLPFVAEGVLAYLAD